MSIDKRITDKFREQIGFDFDKSCILFGKIGSHSHGTYIPPTDPNAIDDVDYMGIVIPPLEYTFGLKHFEHWTLQFEELDVVVYSLQKAARMLVKNNPNIIGLLWLNNYEHLTPEGIHLVSNRELFSSNLSIASFIGYAQGQLKKMETFDINVLAKFEEMKTQISEYSAKGENPPLEVSEKYQQLKSKYFSGYMGEKRKKLVQENGYDCKNASHLIRLLRMGIEFVQTGKLNVFRPDAQELIDIKQGKWTLDQVKAESDLLMAKFRESEQQSVLLETPNLKDVDEVLIYCHAMFYGVEEGIYT